jgi:hypothetical protein
MCQRHCVFERKSNYQYRLDSRPSAGPPLLAVVEVLMAIHDLNRIVRLTVGCPKCQRESLYPAAMIIERTALTCICGRTTDLTGEERAAFRGGLADALVNLHPLYARVPA